MLKGPKVSFQNNVLRLAHALRKGWLSFAESNGLLYIDVNNKPSTSIIFFAVNGAAMVKDLLCGTLSTLSSNDCRKTILGILRRKVGRNVIFPELLRFPNRRSQSIASEEKPLASRLLEISISLLPVRYAFHCSIVQ